MRAVCLIMKKSEWMDRSRGKFRIGRVLLLPRTPSHGSTNLSQLVSQQRVSAAYEFIFHNARMEGKKTTFRRFV